ncbi:MAG: mechanosensitive ion channel family protein [Nanoarchaeota archaeon]|nr:mechanosensitive ion channel family protein [Nanoarchaeota archaeon]
MAYDYRLNSDYFQRVLKRLLLIIIFFLAYQIVNNLELEFYVSSFLKIFIIAVIIQNVFRIVSRTLIYLYLRAKNLPFDLEDLFIVGMKHIFNVIKVIIIFFVSLNILQIDFSTFFTSMALVGVAMAILFKDFISNMLNGMYLFFSDKFNLKQYVEINGVRGVITDISFQTIEMKNDSGDYVYIPNSTIQTKEIVNFSRESLKQIEIELSLLRDEMPLIKSIEKEVKKKLQKEYEELLSKKDENPIVLEYIEISSKEVSFKFKIKTSKYSFAIERRIKQFTYHVIGELLIKYHKSEKSKFIEMEEKNLKQY